MSSLERELYVILLIVAGLLYYKLYVYRQAKIKWQLFEASKYNIIKEISYVNVLYLFDQAMLKFFKR